MASARAYEPNIGALAERLRVFTPERRGHARTADVEGPISYELMAEDTIAFIETVIGGPAHVAGMSDGAIVALLVALRRPDLVPRLACIAGVFHRDGWLPEAVDPDQPLHPMIVKGYEELSPDGPEHFPVFAAKMRRMHGSEPALTAADLGLVESRTLVMVGDDDEVVLEHAIQMYRSIRDAELAVVPGTSHGLLYEKAALTNTML